MSWLKRRRRRRQVKEWSYILARHHFLATEMLNAALRLQAGREEVLRPLGAAEQQALRQLVAPTNTFIAALQKEIALVEELARRTNAGS